MKRFALLLVLAAAVPSAQTTLWSQTTGDYRSATPNGNWSSTSTWQQYDGSNWVAATSTPASGGGVITIQSGHIITVDANVAINKTVIASGGQITIASGKTLTIANDTGSSLRVNGIVLNQGTVAVGTDLSWRLNAGATFIQNSTSSISAALDLANIDPGSTFEYRDSGNPDIDGRSYGTLKLTTTSSKTYASSGTNALDIEGDFVIGSGVTWNSGGFSGEIGVSGNATVSGTWTGGGSGDLGNHYFYNTFTVGSSGTYNLATTGATQGIIQFQGDIENDGAFSAPTNRNVSLGSEGLLTIRGTSTLYFNNGFTANWDIAIASGAIVQVAAGKTAAILGDLEVDGTLQGGNASTSVISMQRNGHDVTFPESPGGTISSAKLLIDCGEGSIYFSGYANLTNGASVEVNSNLTMSLEHGSADVKGGTITVDNNAVLDLYCNDLTIDGVSLILASTATIYDSECSSGQLITKGNTTIDQGGALSVVLQVLSGTTTASGVNSFESDITVGSGATLSVPSGKTLRATAGVDVEGGTISGPGSFSYAGGSDYGFTNNGTVSAPTTFEALGGDYSCIDGNGIAPICSMSSKSSC